LTPDHFTAVLPLLRRTFSTFAAAERRQMGTRVTSGKTGRTRVKVQASEFDEARAQRALPVVGRLLGI